MSNISERKHIERVTVSVDIPFNRMAYSEDRWKLMLQAIGDRANDYASKGMGLEHAVLRELMTAVNLGIQHADAFMRQPLPPVIIKKE